MICHQHSKPKEIPENPKDFSKHHIPLEHMFKEEPNSVFFHFPSDGKEYVYQIEGGKPVLLGMLTSGPYELSPGKLAIRYGIPEDMEHGQYDSDMLKAKAHLEGMLDTQVHFTPFERNIYKSPQ